MRKILQSILVIAIVSIAIDTNSQTRYLDDVFSAVTVTSDVTYATNISILPVLVLTFINICYLYMVSGFSEK